MASARALFLNSMAPGPGAFFPRIGGSDFDAIVHWSNPVYSWSHAAKSIPGKLMGRDRMLAFDPRKRVLEKRVRELNGFFDINPETNHRKSFERFLRSVSDSIISGPAIVYSNQNLVSFLEGGLNHPTTKWVEDYLRQGISSVLLYRRLIWIFLRLSENSRGQKTFSRKSILEDH